MVTATRTPAHTPHALESGPRLATLWAIDLAVSTAVIGGYILVLPILGRSLAWDNGTLTTQTHGTVILVTALILGPIQLALSAAITRTLNMGIPGRLLPDAPPPRLSLRLIGPTTRTLILGTCAGYAATHSAGDHGLTKSGLMVVALLLLGAAITSLGVGIFTKGPRWRTDTLPRVSFAAFDSGILCLASFAAAPGSLSPHLVTPEFGAVVVTLAVIITLLGAAWQWVNVPKAPEMGSAPRDVSRDPLFHLASRVHADLTLEKYQRTQRLLLWGVAGVVALAVFIAFIV